MLDNDHAVDAAARLPVGRDLHIQRVAARNKIIKDLIGDCLVKNAAIAEIEVVVLQSLEFDAYIIGDVLNGDRSKVG